MRPWAHVIIHKGKRSSICTSFLSEADQTDCGTLITEIWSGQEEEEDSEVSRLGCS